MVGLYSPSSFQLGYSLSTANGPFAKFQYIIREIAKSLDLDPDKVTNNINDAAIQAEIMKAFQQEQMPPPQQGQAAPAGADPMDTSGPYIPR